MIPGLSSPLFINFYHYYDSPCSPCSCSSPSPPFSLLPSSPSPPTRPLLPRHCGFSPSTASFGMEPIVGSFDVSPPGPHRRRLSCQLTHDLYEEEILDPISWDLSHHMKVKWCLGSTRSVSGRRGSPVDTTLKRCNIHMAPPYRPITAQLRAAFLRFSPFLILFYFILFPLVQSTYIDT